MKYKLEFVKRKDDWGGITKFPNCTTTFGPYLTRSGKLYTGLTDEDIKRIAPKVGLEEKDLQPEGSYFKTYAIKVTMQGVDINTDDPFDEITYIFCKHHHLVADGHKGVTNHHQFVLLDAEAEAKKHNVDKRKMREAYRELDKMTVDEMRRCLRVMGVRPGGLTNEMVESKLTDLIEEKTELFFTRWVENKNKDLIEILEHAIELNIIRRNKNIFYYGTDIIGNSTDDTLAWMKDKNNKEIFDGIKNELTAKSKI